MVKPQLQLRFSDVLSLEEMAPGYDLQVVPLTRGVWPS